MNFTHEISSLRDKIEQLETALDDTVTIFSGHGIATLVLARAVLVRQLADEPSWRAALDDVVATAEGDVMTIAISGKRAGEVRAAARNAIAATLADVSASMQAWDEQGRPSLDELGGLPN